MGPCKLSLQNAILQLYTNTALPTAEQAEKLLPLFATILSLSPAEVNRWDDCRPSLLRSSVVASSFPVAEGFERNNHHV